MDIKLIAVWLIFFVLSGCKNGNSGGGLIRFYKDTINFGEIKKGDSAIATFQFESIGDRPVKIINVEPSCTCSVVDYPKREFEKNTVGRITVKYLNSEDLRDGPITKLIAVQTNCKPSIHILTIEGIVRISDN